MIISRTPQLGDITRGRFIGKSSLFNEYVWAECPICKYKRWVFVRGKRTSSHLCVKCTRRRGERHHMWKGGRFKRRGGYFVVQISGDSPYSSMCNKGNKGYVFEHRLVMAQHLGRPLLNSEIIHHINSDKTDNRIENLELISALDHNIKTKYCLNCELKKEIRLLRWQIKEQSEQIRNLTSKLLGVGD